VRQAPQLPATLVFIPLLAAWAIWVGLAVSARVSDTRVAQQLSTLGSLPALAAPQDIQSPNKVTAHRKGELKCRRL
jgi:hypothetical protein